MFEIALELAPTITASAAALASLYFGFKRVCGFDLELRTQRAEQRARALEAEEMVRQLEWELDLRERARQASDDDFHRSGLDGDKPRVSRPVSKRRETVIDKSA